MPSESQRHLGNTVSLTSGQASLQAKQINHKIIDCFLLLWILSNIPSLAHKMYKGKTTKLFPQIVSKPPHVTGMTRGWGCTGCRAFIYLGALCAADLTAALKWIASCFAKVLVNHFYICLCLPILLGRTTCSQLGWFNLFSKPHSHVLNTKASQVHQVAPQTLFQSRERSVQYSQGKAGSKQ